MSEIRDYLSVISSSMNPISLFEKTKTKKRKTHLCIAEIV